MTPDDSARGLPIEIHCAPGYFLSSDRSRVVRLSRTELAVCTFIDPAPRVSAWGLSARGKPWYHVHVGPYERIVTTTDLATGDAWWTFRNVVACASHQGRKVLRCLVQHLLVVGLPETAVRPTLRKE